MNDIRRIKELLEKYYEGTSTDDDELHLREYFASDDTADELRPYRAIFAYQKREKEQPRIEEYTPQETNRHWRIRPIYSIAVAAAACLLVAVFFIEKQSLIDETPCSGTYVMVDGVCYNDLSLVKQRVAETIDQTIVSSGDDAASDILDFLDETVDPLETIKL